MLNWKFQQFTKTLFPKKQTPMRNKKNQSRKKLTPFIVLQEIHLPKYIYFYIYRYYFLKFKHPKFKRERKKKSKTSVFPTPSRICWSLLVQNQKELFTERRTGGGWECRKEEDEVVMGGEKTVELGPRRGEASLSSAGLFLRKTLRWGSVPSVPLPLCSVQGSCLSQSQSHTRCSVFIAALFPTLSLGLPTPASQPWTSAVRGITRSKGSVSRVSAAPSWAPSQGSMTGSNGCCPFPSH